MRSAFRFSPARYGPLWCIVLVARRLSVIDEAPVKPARTRTRRKRWVDQRSTFWVRLLIALFTPIFRLWIRYFRWFDVGKVPSTGPFFLISNHTTGMDPFLTGFSLRHRAVRGPGRIELFSHLAAAFIMRKMGMFPLRQRVADPVAIRTVVELLRADQLVTVYPEGGRSKDGALQPFDIGFARLALRLRAPLVPMAIAGGTQLMPMGSMIPKRNTAVVAVYGDAFDLSRFYGQGLTPEVLSAAAQVMHVRVAELLQRAQQERSKILSEHPNAR